MLRRLTQAILAFGFERVRRDNAQTKSIQFILNMLCFWVHFFWWMERGLLSRGRFFCVEVGKKNSVHY